MNTETAPPAQSNPLRADAERLSNIIMEMQRCFVLHLCKELAPGNVSFPQFFLLAALEHREMMTMSEIAQKMGHTTAAASGLVARLENLGFLLRSGAPDDRRKVMVCITTKGTALVRRIREEMISNLMKMMGHLSASEQKAWLEIYSKIYSLCQNNGMNQCVVRAADASLAASHSVSQLERPRPRRGTARRSLPVSALP